MRKRLLWRRSATALGIYGSTALGILGSIVVLRILGPSNAGRFSLAIGTAAFFQLLLELTGDEALVKYGFRYAAQEDWGRFHRLVRLTFGLEAAAALVATLIVVLLAPFADSLFNTTGMLEPMLLAACLPLLQAAESMGAATLILRSRYDIRGALLTLATGLRLVAIVIAAPHGVNATVAAIVVAQLLTSICVVAIGINALSRFPRVAPGALGDDRSPVLRFVLQSSIGTGLISLRGWLAPLALGVVQNPTEVGYFRAAQAPQQGFAALSSPVRLILLTEQTRDWEQGRPEVVWRGVRRYLRGATALMLVALIPLELAMGWLVRFFLGAQYGPAIPAARIILVAAAIQVVFGWSKSFPVSIGRPGLRIVASGIEAAVMLPLIVVFGSLWGATGAAGAVVASSVAYGAAWIVILLRLRRGRIDALTPTEAGVS
jgi:O-antigen/teichoic acid export membrane protein